MLQRDPDVTAGSAGGVGIFLCHCAPWWTWSRKCDSSSIPNKAGIKAQRGVEFTMTPVRLHGSSGSRDCEDMCAYH